MTMPVPVNAGKIQAGRFPKGTSGNPGGRKLGTRNRATMAAQALMEGQLETITVTLIEAAINGDLTAIKMILDKLLPPAKERPLSLKLPIVKAAADLPKMTQAILQAVSAGELTPGEGEKLAGLVTQHGKALELCDIETRLQKLEARQ